MYVTGIKVEVTPAQIAAMAAFIEPLSKEFLAKAVVAGNEDIEENVRLTIEGRELYLRYVGWAPEEEYVKQEVCIEEDGSVYPLEDKVIV